MSSKNRSREGGKHRQRRQTETCEAFNNDPTLPQRIAERRAFDEKWDYWGRPRAKEQTQ